MEKFSFEKKFFFFEIFWQIFTAFYGLIYRIKIFKKFSKKFFFNFFLEIMTQKFNFFFQIKIFIIFFNFFAKLEHEYQNALNFLEKKPISYVFKRLTSMLDTLYQQSHFTYAAYLLNKNDNLAHIWFSHF